MLFNIDPIISNIKRNRVESLDLRKEQLALIKNYEKSGEISEPSGHIHSFAVMPNSKLAVAVHEEIIIRDTKTGQHYKTLHGHTGVVRALVVLDNGNLASGSDDKTIKIWSVDGECLQTLIGHSSQVYTLAVLNEGILVSGSADSRIKFWDTENGDCCNTLKGHTEEVLALTMLPDGKLASGSFDKTIKIWSADGECLQTLSGHTHHVNVLTALHDGTLISGSADSKIKLWAVEDGEYVYRSELIGHTSSIYAFAILPNNQLVSAGGNRGLKDGGDNAIRIWDVATFTCANILKGHASSVSALTVLDDGRLVSGSLDQRLNIKFWKGELPVLTSDNLSTIILTLRENNSLKSLSLAHLNIKDSHIKALAHLLGTNQFLANLTSLNLEINNISNESAKVLMTALEKNTTIIRLNFSNNQLSGELIENFNKLIKDKSASEAARTELITHAIQGDLSAAKRYIQIFGINTQEPRWRQTILHHLLRSLVGLRSNFQWDDIQLNSKTLDTMKSLKVIIKFILDNKNINWSIKDNAQENPVESMVNWMPQLSNLNDTRTKDGDKIIKDVLLLLLDKDKNILDGKYLVILKEKGINIDLGSFHKKDILEEQSRIETYKNIDMNIQPISRSEISSAYRQNLNHKNSTIRKEAAEALGKLKNTSNEIINALIKALDDKVPIVQTAAGKALIRLIKQMYQKQS